MERTFKSLEHEGWNERARLYDDYTARLTSHAIAPLLDVANVRSARWIRGATVRMTMLIEAQTPHAHARIEETIRRKFQEFA
jgi:hypothetical protein